MKVPGLSNIWVPPIRNRIDMLATGIKSPIGVKVSGTSLAEIERITRDIEAVAKEVPGVSSALAERLTGDRYVDIQIDRLAAARYGLSIADVQAVVSGAIGGSNIGETVEGLAHSRSACAIPGSGVTARKRCSACRFSPQWASKSP